jgi:hypothetical protein
LPFSSLAYAVPSAQNASSQAPAAGGKKALTIADYSRWRTINGAQLSGDGKWVAYGLAFTNVPQAETKPVLTILNLDTNQKTEIADATGASFSADSMWIAYTVEPGGGRGGRGGGRGGGGGAAAGSWWWRTSTADARANAGGTSGARRGHRDADTAEAC